MGSSTDMNDGSSPTAGDERHRRLWRLKDFFTNIGRKTLTGVFLFGVLAVLFITGFGCQKERVVSVPASPSVPSPTKIPDNWRTFRSSVLGLSIAYPPSWGVHQIVKDKPIIVVTEQPGELVPEADFLAAPLVLSIESRSRHELESELRKIDPSFEVKTFSLGGREWRRYFYAYYSAGIGNQKDLYLYVYERLPGKQVTASVPADANLQIVEAILTSLETGR